MVAMSVCNHYMADSFAANRVEQLSDMLRVAVGTRIDDRHAAMADDIAASARKGKRPAIMRNKASQERRYLRQTAFRSVSDWGKGIGISDLIRHAIFPIFTP
jgi:hypothetical protein